MAMQWRLTCIPRARRPDGQIHAAFQILRKYLGLRRTRSNLKLSIIPTSPNLLRLGPHSKKSAESGTTETHGSSRRCRKSLHRPGRSTAADHSNCRKVSEQWVFTGCRVSLHSYVRSLLCHDRAASCPINL